MQRWMKGVYSVSSVLVLFLIFGFVWNSFAAEDEDYKNLIVFSEVIRKVQDSYVEKPDIRKLTVGALRGLAYGVDAFSCYLTPEERRFVETRKGDTGVTGVVLTPRSGFYRILAVVPGSSADKAGLFPGDLVEEIERKGTSEMPPPYVQAALSGPVGSEVRLGIQRGQSEELKEVVLKRTAPIAQAPEYKILEQGIGLLKIREFSAGVTEEVKRALNAMSNSGVKSLVLDLRDNCSGNYPDALETANLFVGTGNLALQKGHGPEAAPTPIPAKAEKLLFPGSLVVMVNGFTSGPAEVVAGAIKDSGRGKIVGLKTYGTASEQKDIVLPDGAVMRLTTVRYLSPSGTAITNEKTNLAGIKPDLKSPPEDFALSLYIDYDMATGEESAPLYRKYVDSVYAKQLEQALELLKNPQMDLKAEVVAAE